MTTVVVTVTCDKGGIDDSTHVGDESGKAHR